MLCPGVVVVEQRGQWLHLQLPWLEVVALVQFHPLLVYDIMSVCRVRARQKSVCEACGSNEQKKNIFYEQAFPYQRVDRRFNRISIQLILSFGCRITMCAKVAHGPLSQ